MKWVQTSECQNEIGNRKKNKCWLLWKQVILAVVCKMDRSPPLLMRFHQFFFCCWNEMALFSNLFEFWFLLHATTTKIDKYYRRNIILEMAFEPLQVVLGMVSSALFSKETTILILVLLNATSCSGYYSILLRTFFDSQYYWSHESHKFEK